MDREVYMTSGTYAWSFVTQIFHNRQPSHGSDRKTVDVIYMYLFYFLAHYSNP
jgi:hypothetical protein